MVQGAKVKSFKIPLSVSLDDSGKIIACNSLASTSNLASICNSLGRSVDKENKKCNAPSLFKKGETPVHIKQYANCEGGTGPGEHILDSWTTNGSGAATLSWSGMSNDENVTWRVYKNTLVISNSSGSGLLPEFKSMDVSFTKGDIFKHTATLSGGVENACVSGGSFSVGLDLLNM